MKNYLVFISIFTFNIFANPNDLSLDARGLEAFKKLHAHASINCTYKKNLSFKQRKSLPIIKVIHQKYDGENVESNMLFDSTFVRMHVFKAGVRGEFTLETTRGKLSGILNNNNYFTFKNLTTRESTIYNMLQLDKVDCSLELAMENNVVVKEKNLHVIMHPQYAYDIFGRATQAVQREIDEYSGNQVLYLDDYVRKMQKINFNRFPENVKDFRINLMLYRGQVRNGVSVKAPWDVPYKISPAGINRYTLTQKEHEITFSGGNHNYCIVNNGVRLINALLDNKKSKTLQINYVMDAIVVQRGSFRNSLVTAMNIPKYIFNKSHILSDVFKNMSSQQRNKYQQGLANYFQTTLALRNNHFRTAKIINSGDKDLIEPYTIELQGTGQRNLVIYLNYN